MDIEELRALVDSAASAAPRGARIDAAAIVHRGTTRQRARRAVVGVAVIVASAGALAVLASSGHSSVTTPATHVRIVPSTTVAPQHVRGNASQVCTAADLRKPFAAMPAPMRVAARFPFDSGGQQRLEVSLNLRPSVSPQTAWNVAVAQLHTPFYQRVEKPPAGGHAQLLLGLFTTYSELDIYNQPGVLHQPAWVMLGTTWRSTRSGPVNSARNRRTRRVTSAICTKPSMR